MAHNLDRDEVARRVKEAVALIEGDPEIASRLADDMPLFDFGDDPQAALGLDSIDGLELALFLKEQYGVDILADLEDYSLVRTVGDIAQYVIHLVEAKGQPKGQSRPALGGSG